MDETREIKNLQRNLAAIRKIAGWTLEGLGDKIGVTKQTIANLEKLTTPMNKTQYLALRLVIDYEIYTHPDNELLKQAVHILLTNYDNLDDEAKETANRNMDVLSAAVVGGASRSSLTALCGSMFGPLGMIAGMHAGAIDSLANITWMQIIDKKKKTKEE